MCCKSLSQPRRSVDGREVLATVGLDPRDGDQRLHAVAQRLVEGAEFDAGDRADAIVAQVGEGPDAAELGFAGLVTLGVVVDQRGRREADLGQELVDAGGDVLDVARLG